MLLRNAQRYREKWSTNQNIHIKTCTTVKAPIRYLSKWCQKEYVKRKYALDFEVLVSNVSIFEVFFDAKLMKMNLKIMVKKSQMSKIPLRIEKR